MLKWNAGYKAAGDVAMLQQLGSKYGMQVSIVNLVSTPNTGQDQQVSSSRIRQVLEAGRVDQVAALLDRAYRLVLYVGAGEQPATTTSGGISVPLSAAMNQPPGAGSYRCCVSVQPGSLDEIQVDGEPIPGSAVAEVRVSDDGIHIPSLAPGFEGKASKYVVLDFL